MLESVRGSNVALVAFALAGIASACAAFDSVPEETAPPPSTDDASVTDGPNADSASVVDASAPDANDAGGNADASSNPCATQHLLCDRFERDGGPVHQGWSSALTSGSGTLAISALAAAPSPPSVLTSTVDGIATAQLAFTSYADAKGIRCDLDMLVDVRGTSQTVLFGLGVANSGDGYYYRVEARGGGTDALLRYGTVKSNDLTQATNAAFGTDIWHRFTVELSFGTPRFVRVTMDGTKMVEDLDIDAGATMNAAEESIVIGTQSLTDGSEWQVRFDDVVCDLIQ